MNRPIGPARRSSNDDDVVQAAARKVGLQLAAVCTVLVIVVGVLAFTLIGHRGGEYPPGRPPEPSGDRDELVRNALLAAGAVGVVIAGLVGWLAARNAVRPLGQALQLQRQFVADAGHELRTPLTILHTRAQLLARRLPADSPQRPLVDQLLADSRVMGEIVEELLTSAQLAGGPNRGERFSAAELVQEVATSMSALADAAQITLLLDRQSGADVLGSRTALRRALVALTDNAIAHTPAGGTVTLACRTVGREVTLQVSDNGEGLDPADTEHLMTRFTRGTAGPVQPVNPEAIPSRRFGLGLSLVGEVARAHGGRLELTGAPGTGAQATITVPAAPTLPGGRTG